MPFGRAPPTSELQRGNAVPAVNRNLQYSRRVDRRVSRQPFCLMYCIFVGGLWFDFMVQVHAKGILTTGCGHAGRPSQRVCDCKPVNATESCRSLECWHTEL